MIKPCLIGLPLCLFLFPSTILACFCGRQGPAYSFNGLEFRLPAGSIVRTIEGEVVWDDGTPAADVQVLLLCPRSTAPNGFTIEPSPTTTHTDNEGRFHLEGFTGETYWLEARGSKNAPMHSPSRKLSITDHVKNLRLKLSKVGRFGGGCR